MIYPNLLLFEKAAVASACGFVDNITYHLPDWQRQSRDIGGFWLGDGTITEATMSRAGMGNAFNTWLGRRVIERTAGIDTWDGEITQLDFTLDGVTFRRSLDPEGFHNRVKVAYRDYLLGSATATSWTACTSSSQIWGGSEYIDTVGGNYGTESAETLRDTRLKANVFPRAYPVGIGGEKGAMLVVYCSGYVFSMNRRYRETDLAASPISSHVTTLVNASEFVSPGRIIANSASMAVKASNVPQRLWEITEELVLAGGSAQDLWVGGVWENKKFHYEPAETEVTHLWHEGRLLTKAGTVVPAPFVKPGIIVRVGGLPFSESLPGASEAWNEARNVYIQDVEFTTPDVFRLIPSEGDPLVGRG